MVNGQCLVVMLWTSMVWSFGMDLLRPIRKYVMKRTYFRRFRRMLKDNNLTEKDKIDLNSTSCPSCRLPFDKGKKRRLIDTCGHTRCYTCIFTTDYCPLCQPQAQPKVQHTRRPNSYFFPRQVALQTRPNSISIDNQQQLAELAKHHNFRHRSSPHWIIGDRAQSVHEISKVEIHPNMDLEMTENILLSRGTLPSVNTTKRSSMPGKSSLVEQNANSIALATDNPGSLMSMTSQKDLFSPTRQNLRSREQSLTSLMSISSRSSSTPTDILKHIDEKDERALTCSRRFSLAQSSNVSLDISTDSPSNLPSEKSSANSLRLKPLYFEVPQPESDHPFIGRQWLFKEIEKILQVTDANNYGMAVIGGPGTGKTSCILQLVDYSSFGRKWEETLSQTTQDIYWKIRDLTNCADGDQMSISSRGSQKFNSTAAKDPVLHHAASRVVGYHFCQADYDATCTVSDFVHSLAAQLCQAPQLAHYRDLLLKEPRYQSLLCLDSCLADPDKAFVKGILEPLRLLTMPGPAESHTVLVVVDSLHEAEEYKSSEKTTIATFLAKHLPLFPQWLKLIVSVRTDCHDIVSSLQLKCVSLDLYSNDFVQQDLLNYIHYRISNSSSIQTNINAGKKDEEECAFLRFAEYLSSVSNGSFLYTKLILDLIHQRHLVIKSSSFSVLPVHLSQVFMLTFNLKFTSNSSFDRVCPILQICLASLYPLTVLEVYHSLNARHRSPQLTWFEFSQQVELLTSSHILVHRLDGSLMVAHPALREWLTTRDPHDGKKFLCDPRQGHIYLALRMARLEAPLSPEQGLEFADHLLRANLSHAHKDSITSDFHLVKNMQALWLQHCLLDTSASLSHERNIFAPSIKVSRFLLQAGANPNVSIGIRSEIPLLNLASDKGFAEFAFLLLEFGADCNVQNQDDGITPLMAASRKGHETVLQILLAAGAKVYQKDADGKTALSYAAEKGFLDIIKILIKSHWPDHFSLNGAITNAFVSASGKGHLEVCEHLLKETDIQVNSCDPVSGHTALTFASWRGHTLICRLLLERGATVVAPSRTGAPPIIWAVRGAHSEMVQLLVTHQATLMQMDKEGKTPLMWAAAGNHTEIMKLLLEKGISINAKDFEGFTALAWASAENHIEAAQCLLEHEANIECLDIKGRTPLSLAVKHRDGEMVNTLLKYGANMEHKDYSGNSPLEEAICGENITAVSKLLHQGVKLGPKIWCSAQRQPNMLLVLMHKLLSDGVVLYKKEKLQESGQRFQYALKKFPPEELQGEKKLKFKQLKFYLHLGLSRSHRKLKEYVLAIEAADEALKIRSDSFEALYVRAKAKHEAGQYHGALLDVTRAIHVVHDDIRVIQTLQSLRADILTSSKIVCPLDDGNRAERQLADVSVHEVSSHLPSQPCRTLVELQQSNSRLSLPDKKHTFGMSNEIISAIVH